MKFFLGTHEVSWLGRTAVPLFISRRRLARQKTWPRALGPWALDSGGFTEIAKYGRWVTEPKQYADELLVWSQAVGAPVFAAIQDWMCEPKMLAKTGLSIREHQHRTIQSYLDLKAICPTTIWAPVLQGWKIDEYFNHAEQYVRAGVNLEQCQRVGVGSVCRRQDTYEIWELFAQLAPLRLKLHGFGLKTKFIDRAFSNAVTSFDSMAWSSAARHRGKPLDGCTHKTCANCMRYAIQWRDALVSVGKKPRQDILYLTGVAS